MYKRSSLDALILRIFLILRKFPMIQQNSYKILRITILVNTSPVVTLSAAKSQRLVNKGKAQIQYVFLVALGLVSTNSQNMVAFIKLALAHRTTPNQH